MNSIAFYRIARVPESFLMFVLCPHEDGLCMPELVQNGTSSRSDFSGLQLFWKLFWCLQRVEENVGGGERMAGYVRNC